MGGSPNDKDFVNYDDAEEAARDDEGTAVENEGDAIENDADVREHDSSLATRHSSLPLSVCLVSGGMDSCVTAAIAREEGGEPAFLHVSYGQLTEARERRAFEELADFYKVTRRLAISLEHLARIGGSSLTDPSIPVEPANLSSQEIPTSYVPFRNAHLLSVAVSWSEVIGAARIYIGAVSEDSSGYPDCRPEFYEAFQRAVDVGTKPSTRVEIRTPVIRMRKAEIIRRGVELGAPLSVPLPDFLGRRAGVALRLRAFREAGLEDPIPYA